MSKINSYSSAAELDVADKIIGTDVSENNETKNFTIGNLITYLLSKCADGTYDLGNTIIDGTLNVVGAVTLDDELTVTSTVTFNAGITAGNLPEFPDDASAGLGGLTSGQFYRTSGGGLRAKL